MGQPLQIKGGLVLWVNSFPKLRHCSEILNLSQFHVWNLVLISVRILLATDSVVAWKYLHAVVKGKLDLKVAAQVWSTCPQ